MRNTYFTYIMVRVFKHRKGWYEGAFTARYTFDMLVYFEREKEIKGWRRGKKLRLVLKTNPDWADQLERR